MEVINTKENPDLTFNLNPGTSNIKENSLTSGILFRAPESINAVNNGNSLSRFIFKFGFEVDNSWHNEGYNIDGTVYSKENKLVYKFPSGGGDKKKNFTNVEITVKPLQKESEPLSENIKFCYSTSLGMPIESSKENCFRTGANIPYTLTFINPLISPKKYKSYIDNYYVTLIPQNANQYISLSITENKYETKDRNVEGFGKIITLDEGDTKSTILSLPENFYNNKIFLQLQICKSVGPMVNYALYDAYTESYIRNGNVQKKEKFFYTDLSYNLVEMRLEFKGEVNEKLFVKHSGVTDYELQLENYYAEFDQNVNVVWIHKPVKDEEFMITVLVGKKGRFNDYNLCTFTDISEQQLKNLGDYVKSFPSNESDPSMHYIDFRSFEDKGYNIGDEFDLLIYAKQSNNSKLEFLYPVISGVVGKVEHVFTKIEGTPESNVVSQTFKKNDSNYLYYDFVNEPVGDIASLRIVNEGEVSVKISKVICTFVEKGKTDEDMVKIINLVPQGGINLCKGQEKQNYNGYDALVNAVDVKEGLNRLLILVQYGFGVGEEENLKDENELKINLRITGFDVTEAKGYNEKEDNVFVPYVFDVNKIRGTSQSDYISKVLIYSSKRELEMFHLALGTPTQLFSGNILLVYTNPEVVKEKYYGATKMILLTESLSKDSTPVIGENFRFKTYFFKSDNTMNYYVSSNAEGRPINIPTSLEMPSCDKPYYYILNYHFPEQRDLTLHMDKIYGELTSKKIATQLNKEDWFDLIDGMEEITGDEYLITQKDKYHMDVMEATCTIPTLLHIYYTDDQNPILTGIGPGSASIINLAPQESKTFQLQTSVLPEYNLIFSFNILLEEDEPNIKINFPLGDPIIAKKNGVYIKKTRNDFESITITNEEISGSSKVRIIFKYGYEIEDKFELIKNDVYHLNQTENLFGYIFKTEEDWLNYTSISFLVSTSLSNVKFCYSTSFGTYMKPSLQDCYRVGVANTYTLTILNPYLMYKDYKTVSDEVMKYYVGFKTVEKEQNITITPTFNKYKTNLRNFEDISNSITVTKSTSTILTSPSENNKYIFLQLQVCTENKVVEFELLNAYNQTSLNYRVNVDYYQKINYYLIENIRLDTELSMKVDTSSKIFVKHSGINEEYYPAVEDISLRFMKANNTLVFNTPIQYEEINYTIYVDHKGSLGGKILNLCNVTENTKLAHYSKEVTSAEDTVYVPLDFNSGELKNYKEFDIVVLAQEINNGKLRILSDVITARSHKADEGNTELIIIIVVLTVILICGGIAVFIFLRKYKNAPNSKKLDAKQTSLAMVDNENEKMIMSTATEKND